MDQARSWIKENSTLVLFLVGQIIAIGAAAAAILAYAVKLETRVHIMETRGAEYTVARMEEMKMRITILEQTIRKSEDTLERVRDQILRDMQQKPQPR